MCAVISCSIIILQVNSIIVFHAVMKRMYLHVQVYMHISVKMVTTPCGSSVSDVPGGSSSSNDISTSNDNND